MFFIGIFGVDTAVRPLGVTAPRACGRCHNTVPWTIYETHRRFTLFFIPIFTWGHGYYISCPVCIETLGLRSLEEALNLKRGEFTG